VGELFCTLEYQINFLEIFHRSTSQVGVIKFSGESFESGDGFAARFALVARQHLVLSC
jgi:hypothetical protein